MNIYEKSHKLSDSEFKRLIGVQRETFEEMLQILRKAYTYIHQSRGRKSKLSLEEMLFVTLKYLRQYPTMKELAFEYNVAESSIHHTITWVEDTLIRSRKFTLPNRKALVQSDFSIEFRVEKRQTRALSIERILIENMNANIKVFKIFSQKYRNRRKRHLLRMSLVCGIYNFEL